VALGGGGSGAACNVVTCISNGSLGTGCTSTF
jgi:hypothetical protein